MIADLNNMPRMYHECKVKYFGDCKLPTPKFAVMHKKYLFGCFSYYKNCGRHKKHPISNPTILMTDYYDFDEKDFIDIMTHEIIHYYVMYNGIDTKNHHGNAFKKMMNELNEKYGLNIEIKKDTFSFKKNKNVPKKSFLSKTMEFIFG